MPKKRLQTVGVGMGKETELCSIGKEVKEVKEVKKAACSVMWTDTDSEASERYDKKRQKEKTLYTPLPLCRKKRKHREHPIFYKTLKTNTLNLFLIHFL